MGCVSSKQKKDVVNPTPIAGGPIPQPVKIEQIQNDQVVLEKQIVTAGNNKISDAPASENIVDDANDRRSPVQTIKSCAASIKPVVRPKKKVKV